ncbi:hypothetical protein JCM10207_002830 [Rhodosporidiobolus poonsookiae]
MGKSVKGGFYAVRVGRQPGVYTTWDDAKRQVDGFVAARHKKFPTRAEAEAFVGGQDGPTASTSAGGVQTKLATSTNVRKGKGRALDEDEPPAKKQRREVDPIFRSGTLPKGRHVYCDGSSRGNGQKGATAGIGVFWSHEEGANNLSERLPGGDKLQTNNRAEMYAVARILETDPHPEQPLTICSDSTYTIDAFSKWIPSWRRRGWKTADNKDVANKDLILYILSLLALRTRAGATPSATSNITFHKVKAHVGIEGNEQADRFANAGALKPPAPDRDFAQATKDNERKLREGAGKGESKVKVEDVKWEVEIEEGDLLDAEELAELERTQAF